MNFDAFYFERVCTELGQLEYNPPLMHKFIEKLKDGDTVALVGCGLQPDSVLALDRLCEKDVKIYGIDPVLQQISTDSKRVKLVPDTLERFLGVKSDNGLGTNQEMIKQAVENGARLIAMYVCACEDSYNSKSLALDIKLTAKNQMDDLRVYLKNNGYAVGNIEDNHFAILAEKIEKPNIIDKPEGMSEGLYHHLEKHGHFS